MINLSETARLLGVNELAVLFELRILGQPRGTTQVSEELLATLFTVFGVERVVPNEDQLDEASATRDEEVRKDTNPRRRVIRRLCAKLISNGKWAPNGMLATTLARGFSDAGEARAAMETLEKASWITVAATRRGYGDRLYALNPDYRAEIIALANRSDSPVPPQIEDWIRQRRP